MPVYLSHVSNLWSLPSFFAEVEILVGLNIDCMELVKAGCMEEEDRLDRNWANWTTFSQVRLWRLPEVVNT